jgi:quercetin dioxygenase-like cupin family protein
VIPAGGGEERVLRGGDASLFIKVDPVSTGSETLMVGYSDLSPGDAIGVHRHLQEDEVMVITRGTGRVQLGNEFHTASAGATIFIPRGTCIGLTNTGTDTLSNFFVFSTPGFERALRRVSTAPGEPVKPLTPELRAEAFHEGHAVANPPDC